MDCLHDELLVSILDRCVDDHHEMANYALVCKRWNRLYDEELPTLVLDCDRLGESEAVEYQVRRIVSNRRNVLKSLDLTTGIFSTFRLLEGTLVWIITSVSATIEHIAIADLDELSQALVNALLECKALRELWLVYDEVPVLNITGTWPRLADLQMTYNGTESSVAIHHLEKMVEACPALVNLRLFVDGPLSMRIRSSSLQKLLLHSYGEMKFKVEAGSMQKLKLAGGCTFELLSGLERLEKLQIRGDALLKQNKVLQNVACLLFYIKGVDTGPDGVIDNLKNVPIRKLVLLDLNIRPVDLSKVVPLLTHCKELECCASHDDLQEFLNAFGEKCPVLATVRLRLPSNEVEVLHLNPPPKRRGSYQGNSG